MPPRRKATGPVEIANEPVKVSLRFGYEWLMDSASTTLTEDCSTDSVSRRNKHRERNRKLPQRLLHRLISKSLPKQQSLPKNQKCRMLQKRRRSSHHSQRPVIHVMLFATVPLSSHVHQLTD